MTSGLLANRSLDWRQGGRSYRNEAAHEERETRDPQEVEWSGLAVFEAMASPYNKATTAVMEFNTTLLLRMAAINSEWTEFIGSRLHEDISLNLGLAACRSRQQFVDVYSSFVHKAFEQYQAEFAHILKVGQVFASQNAELLRRSAEVTQDGTSRDRTRASALRGRSSTKRLQLDSAA